MVLYPSFISVSVNNKRIWCLSRGTGTSRYGKKAYLSLCKVGRTTFYSPWDGIINVSMLPVWGITNFINILWTLKISPIRKNKRSQPTVYFFQNEQNLRCNFDNRLGLSSSWWRRLVWAAFFKQTSKTTKLSRQIINQTSVCFGYVAVNIWLFMRLCWCVFHVHALFSSN